VLLVGPYHGELDNDADTIQWLRPQAPGDPTTGFVLVELVDYTDESPWPSDSDGQGSSLHRGCGTSFANFASSWTAREPSPGAADVAFAGDLDLDGDVDFDDIDDLLLALHDADAYRARFGVSALLTADLNEDGYLDEQDIAQFAVRLRLED
jgi:hypothetical protein